jgi:translation initiation factor IF-2
MAKVRVYQLAKELKVQSALILELLDRMGQDVKSDLSTLDPDTAELVRQRITNAIAAETARIVEERQREQEQAAAAEKHKPAVEEAEAAAAAPATTTTEQPAAPPSAPTPAVEAPAAAAAAPSAPPAERTAAPAGRKPEAATVAPASPPADGARKPRVFAAKRTVPLTTIRPGRPAVGRPGARPGAPAAPGVPPRAPVGQRPGTRPGPPPRKRRGKKVKEAYAPQLPSKPKPELPPVPEKITLSEAATVKELAEKLNRKSKDVIAKLIARGQLVTINQPLDPDVAIAVAKEFGSEASILSFEEEAQQAVAVAEPGEPAAADSPESLTLRPPVVTVMGHVDHGKTSLLDAIRAANVVDREHGGITQHIGAYQVEAKNRKITFLDTPGHEAFTLMRARGAKVTDIVVLVVAADDGVKPQTLEAIDHAKAADVPIVVAINKIDKPEAHPERVKQQLTEHELVVEDYGGTTVSCEISAKKQTGIEDLLEMILLVTDMQELKANADKPASGVVLEARVDRSRGVVATVLVQEGTLKVGDPFIAGSTWGKVRAMVDEHGHRIDHAGPSAPAEVMGLQGEPSAGDSLQGVTDEGKARQIAAFRHEKERAAAMQPTARRSLEGLSRDIAAGDVKELPILLKTDVSGSVEALQKTLADLPQDKIRVNILRASTGAITQADVLLASASNAIIVGFNVRPDRATAELAKREEVELRLYTVIYDLKQDIEQAMVGMLEPTLREVVLGQAEVRQIFKVPKIGMIAGCYVTDGKVARNAEVRLLRDNVVTYTGKVGSLRRFKDDVAEVKNGFECGIGIAGYQDVKEQDVIEFFVTEKIAAESL